jgi:MFS transporter, DHA1 family, multidrug resistance protein
MAFTSVSIDLYLPALPAIEKSFGARRGAAELTISGFLVGFSLGQLFWGALSDRVGRKRPLLAGLCLFVIGSVGCAGATSVASLIAWRAAQALGASAGIVLARAMVRDIHGRERSVQILSVLIGVMAVAPLVGPFVGGQILRFASWRTLFVSLGGFGACVAAAVTTLPEPLATKKLGVRSLSAYGVLLRDPEVMRSAMTGALFYCALFAYVAGTPNAYIHYFGLSPQLYGLVYGSSTSAVILANVVNARTVTRVGAATMLRRGIVIAAWSSLVALGTALTGSTGVVALIVIYLSLTAFAAMVGLVVANSIGLAMAPHPELAGSVSALTGALHYGAGIVGSAGISMLSDGSPKPMALIMVVASIAACWVCEISRPLRR